MIALSASRTVTVVGGGAGPVDGWDGVLESHQDREVNLIYHIKALVYGRMILHVAQWTLSDQKGIVLSEKDYIYLLLFYQEKYFIIIFAIPEFPCICWFSSLMFSSL